MSSGGGGGSGFINTKVVTEGQTSGFANADDPLRGTAGEENKNSKVIITMEKDITFSIN